MTKYADGRIYCIRERMNNDRIVYVGSTTQSLSRRMSQHRCEMKRQPEIKIYALMNRVGVENFHIELLHPFPCANKEELVAEEGRCIRQHQPEGNVRIEGQTKKEWYEVNKTAVIVRQKAYRDANKQHIAARDKKYVEENKETVIARKKEYYESHKEEAKERQKAYYETHKEAASAHQKVYAAANKAKIAAYQKQYREAHKAEIAASKKQWYEAHKAAAA